MIQKLSVIIIALNEEACIGRCLSSVSFADEIILVDNGSTDATLEIAAQLGAKIIVTEDWPGFGPQKNRALAAATGDWILSLDADEWVEPALAGEIKSALAHPQDHVGFEIPRRSRFCGKIVRNAGWSPDLVLRLFRRQAGGFTDSLVHERVVLVGKVARLTQPIEHECITDLGDAYQKIRLYSEAWALQRRESGKDGSLGKAIFRSIWAYVHSYIIRRGILDGSVGLLVAGYSANYTYQKWATNSSMRSVTLPTRWTSAIKSN